ncbi:hypothetical protein [Pseudokineococcus lusitanus]|uniref:SatD family protein n=1 Tax=Pseudokineococcus lusitanus TaxID=763993 RepID=A0A3N1HSY9_9ACTN|nr:hypothetical protein [Pseudokineococcus lusitanus]ROP45579.1 hypothetical protein EDC03_0183 [Pseudokineococcus lusitanus]
MTRPVVLTVDQRGSRRGADAVPALLERLSALRPAPLRPFERTAGDEVQGVLDDAGAVVAAVTALADDGRWSVGVGVGAVRTPLPASTRAGAGVAFEAARRAVEAAKRVREGVAVRGGPDDAEPAPAVVDAETALLLLVDLRRRRSAAGREVVRLVEEGLPAGRAAERLGITPQAVSQRLAAARWSSEQRLVPLAVRLVAAAAG